MAQNNFPHFDPQTVGSQGNAILGIRDSGKSYTAIKIAEMLHDAGIPFVAFDPIGRWRFMRVPGKGQGYPVVVAGGAAGDLPLTVESAPQIVRAAMEGGVSLVLDLYDMEVSKADWKRIVGDSIRVLLYHNGAHGLRHIFIEEAAEFCPQRVGPDQGRVYAEVEKLARMGGNVRLGYTLINQRAEEVNKAVLELCDNLFLHRQKGRNSLNALTKWLNIADVKPGSRKIIESLPTLPQGQCWAWMAGTDRPVHISVPEKNSFEPDRRAMRGNVAAIIRKAVDVASFVSDMKTRLSGKSPLPPAAITRRRPPHSAARDWSQAAVPAPQQSVPNPPQAPPMEDKKVQASEARAIRAENEELRRKVAQLQETIQSLQRTDVVSLEQTTANSLTVDQVIAELIRRADTDPGILSVLKRVPEITVTVRRHTIELDDSTLAGRVAGLITEGFFDTATTANAAFAELKRRGFACAVPSVYRSCDDLTLKGFLRKSESGYTTVAGMKINIVEAA